MTIYLVRHAKAGSRKNWDDDDTQRPLVESGWEQARLLVRKFENVEVTRLISSPYMRCQQTLQPLAEERGLVVEVDERLAENTSRDIVAELLNTVDEGTVLCSHGDVIPEGIELKQKTKGVTGVDFWSEEANFGKIVCVKVGKIESMTSTASVSTMNEWRTSDGIKIMDETRSFTLETAGNGYLIKMSTTLVAKRVKNVASSTAESPPPTTAMV